MGRSSLAGAAGICALAVLAASGAWLVFRDDGGSRTAELEAMQPEVVGARPSAAWPKRIACSGSTPLACVPSTGSGGDILYLKTTFNLHGPGGGIANLFGVFNDEFDEIVVCQPSANRSFRCATVGVDLSQDQTAYLQTFDIPRQGAFYVR